MVNTKFLGLQIDNHINLKNHIRQVIPKLNGACYTFRSVVQISNINTLKSFYYAYCHPIIKYGIIFLGNCSSSGKIITLHKKIVRIMAGAQPRTPCRCLYKQYEIQPVPCQYILPLMSFVINNLEIFQTNSSVHNLNTRNEHHFHRPNAKKVHSMLV